MTVNEFVSLDKTGCMFAAVNADKAGYMTRPEMLIIADKNVLRQLYGDWRVIGFEPKTARRIQIYITSEEVRA